MIRTIHAAAFAGILAFGTGLAAPLSAAELKVVSSFSIIGDLARNVGGEHVAVSDLVGPDGDAHVYEPRPADAAALEAADVVLVNGLEFEGFLSRLIAASGTRAPVVEVSKGVEPLKTEAEGHAHGHAHGHEGHHHHGEFDPHAWQSVANAKIYVRNIADAFCAADAAGCDGYRTNAGAYTERLAALEAEVRAAIAAIPEDRRVVITSHDAFGYFERDYGLKFVSPEGVSTEAEASAADVAKLIDQVREDKASGVFVENITNPGLVEQIARETGLKLGGTLYSDALSGKDGPAPTYIDLFRHNVETIRQAVSVR